MKNKFLLPALLLALIAAQDSRRWCAAHDKDSSAAVGRLPSSADQLVARKYLFIDDQHVERMEGARRVYHQPVKEKRPVLLPSEPWEADFVQHWNAPIWSPERGRWQFWYLGGIDQVPLYAESTDGLTWTKPRLGLVKWQDSAENNLYDVGFPAANFKENYLAILRDDRDPDAARRYKAITHIGANLAPLVSRDGVRWKPIEGDHFYSDDQYRLNYDSLQNRFVATIKFKPGLAGRVGRTVGLSFSSDFVHWTEPQLIFQADATDQRLGHERIQQVLADSDRRHPQFVNADDNRTDVYNMPIFTYADMYLGLPVLFHHSGEYRRPKGVGQDGILAPTLVASRDLQNWDRLSREQFLPHSPLSDHDNFDYAMLHASCPVRRGDELWFYYTGARFTHVKRELVDSSGLRKSPTEPLRGIFLARLRLDGFASLAAVDDRARITTKPIEVTGKRLSVNIDTQHGELRAELRDAATGQPIPGYSSDDCRPLKNQDAVNVDIQWRKSDVSELVGRRVKVEFTLRNAALYAFSFDN